MPVFRLDLRRPPIFPPTELAEPEGVLAVGGALTPDWLLAAYRQGIFPWFEPGSPILWWSPDPRLVLFPAELHVSRRLDRTIRSGRFETALRRLVPRGHPRCRRPPGPTSPALG